MTNILLIDDAQDFCEIFDKMISKIGYKCEIATSLEEGIEKLKTGEFQIVFLDVYLGDHNGLHHLSEILCFESTPDVIVISGTHSCKNVESAISQGAWDFMLKPLSAVELNRCLNRCIKHRKDRNDYISSASFHRGPIIGSSSKLVEALQAIGTTAKTNDNILLLGGTGTGKELFARAIHENSPRKDNIFVVVDCTNLPKTLAQSILFGHEKGTFTDAKERHDGLFRQADEGTIFLDEIADLNLDIQKSLLRVLQEHTFRPLSSKKEIKVNFRIVAATNKNLAKLVDSGKFRQDLYFRINAHSIHLPSLSERKSDIKQLTDHYLIKLCKEKKKEQVEYSEDFLLALQEYSWPGNIRELINTLNYALSNSFNSKQLYPNHLPPEIRSCYTKSLIETSTKKLAMQPSFLNENTKNVCVEIEEKDLPCFKELRNVYLKKIEYEYLLVLINKTNWDIKKACSISRLSRARLYELLQKHEITKNDLK